MSARTPVASAQKDFSLHPARFPATLEKWYLDALLDDGTLLVVYLGTMTVFGARLARVTAELFSADGPVLRGSAVARHIAGSTNVLRFDHAMLTNDGLRFVTDGLSGELVYRPRHSPFTFRAPFLAQADRAIHWSVEIPDADVTGTLRWPGGARFLVGRGYRDHVWYDVLPWHFPIHELVWGRAVSQAHAATWVRATTASDTVATAWLDGHMVPGPISDTSPPGMTLGTARVLLDADVTELEGLRLGALRGLLGSVSGNPHETKWQAPCTIEGTHGVAIGEVVRWRA